MEEEQFNRQKDAPWCSPGAETVMIGGAGGIGSWLAFFLARAGFNIQLYDYDTVETHNLCGQLFSNDSVGLSKVQAVASIVDSYSVMGASYFNSKITEDSPYHHFMFSAFDNMEARKTMFNLWKKSLEDCPVAPILIDGRLEFEQLQIFCVTEDNMDIYEQDFLFDDSVVPEISCTMKQTSHVAAMIASHMVAFFTNHITNINYRETIRDVPLYYEYVIPQNLTESYD